VEGHTLESVALTAEMLQATDCVVITTDHTHLDWDLVCTAPRLIVDTRNALRQREVKGRVVKL
jgi:UDP-N-acetyl-D-glucosamine dehydrogenase